MDKHEEIARDLHKKGFNCSSSLYQAFKEDLQLDEDYPQPRSIDGICGAVLVTEDILNKRGKKELINDYESIFIKKYGSIKCKELTGNRNKCNDYIGFSANYLIENLNQK